MAQMFPNLRFPLVAPVDSHTSNDVVSGKLEHDLLLRLPVLRKIDMAGHSSSERTNDLVMIDTAPWLIK
jgi:hypothetical protein